MQSSYSTGAISKMMILNVLLIAIIVATVFFLLAPGEKGISQQTALPSSSAVIVSKKSQPAAPINTQADIDALKKQLERENSQLQALRVQEKRIDMIRKDSELEAAERLITESKIAMPKSDPYIKDDSAGIAAETQSQQMNPVE